MVHRLVPQTGEYRVVLYYRYGRRSIVSVRGAAEVTGKGTVVFFEDLATGSIYEYGPIIGIARVVNAYLPGQAQGTVGLGDVHEFEGNFRTRQGRVF
jgi:hypothetical protein